jgi:hypothetical protein
MTPATGRGLPALPGAMAKGLTLHMERGSVTRSPRQTKVGANFRCRFTTGDLGNTT